MSTLTLRSDHEKLVDALEDFRWGEEGGRTASVATKLRKCTRMMTWLRLESGANKGGKQLPCNKQPK